MPQMHAPSLPTDASANRREPGNFAQEASWRGLLQEADETPSLTQNMAGPRTCPFSVLPKVPKWPSGWTSRQTHAYN